jgi:pyruvate formate lyase activating enzyme
MIGGIASCSFVDYPENLAAVIFTQGCNLRCRYCHNPQLIPRCTENPIPVPEVLKFLETRRGRLTGVVLSGGEPSLHRDLADLLSAIRAIGFPVKLDTNGTRPDFILRLLEDKLLDYGAVDVKISPGARSLELCGLENQAESAVETLRHFLDKGIPSEARTTVVDGLHDPAELRTLAQMLQSAGVRTWRLQPVEAATMLDASAHFLPPSAAILEQAVEYAVSLGVNASLRFRAASRANLP